MRRTQQKQYNQKAAELLIKHENTLTHRELTEALKAAADDTIPKRLKFEKKEQLTEEAQEIINNRKKTWEEGRQETAKELTQQLKNK